MVSCARHVGIDRQIADVAYQRQRKSCGLGPYCPTNLKGMSHLHRVRLPSRIAPLSAHLRKKPARGVGDLGCGWREHPRLWLGDLWMSGECRAAQIHRPRPESRARALL